MDLLDALISWWSLDEASGDAIDSHGDNDLTETSGTIASVAGKVGNARDFEAGDTEYFTIDSNDSLSFGDEDFSFGCWVNCETNPSTQMYIMNKYAYSANDREYELHYDGSGSDVFRFRLSSDGSEQVSVSSNVAVDTGTWYFVVCWHDATANTVNIQVNNGEIQSEAWSGGCNKNISPFRIGAASSTGLYFDGLIDEAFIYRRVLTADERAWLYNSGNGRGYKDLLSAGNFFMFF